MNKPKSFTAWVVTSPVKQMHGGVFYRKADAVEHMHRLFCAMVITLAMGHARGWRVRKIRCTFV